MGLEFTPWVSSLQDTQGEGDGALRCAPGLLLPCQAAVTGLSHPDEFCASQTYRWFTLWLSQKSHPKQKGEEGFLHSVLLVFHICPPSWILWFCNGTEQQFSCPNSIQYYLLQAAVARIKVSLPLFICNHYVYSLIFIYICITYTLFCLYNQLFYSQGPHCNEL